MVRCLASSGGCVALFRLASVVHFHGFPRLFAAVAGVVRPPVSRATELEKDFSAFLAPLSTAPVTCSAKPGKLGGLGLTCPSTPLCLRVIFVAHSSPPISPASASPSIWRLSPTPPSARPSRCFAGLPGLNPGNTVMFCCAEKTNPLSGFSGCQSCEFSTITIRPDTRFVPALGLETTEQP